MELFLLFIPIFSVFDKQKRISIAIRARLFSEIKNKSESYDDNNHEDFGMITI
jgi:hypothetical protein